MKESLLQYACYNQWANKKMIDLLMGLLTEHLDREIISSFSSLKRTVYHCIGAEYIWLQRLMLAENPIWVGDDLDMPFPEACKLWQDKSEELTRFIEKQYDDNALTHVVQYYDRRKRAHKTQVNDVLQHIFNHNTYHRGNLVTMLRQLDVKNIPSTDYIQFVWNGKK